MPSTLKRPSLGRLLASLRPSRAPSFLVQTGFPTSLANLVVRNHGRLRKGARKPRRPAAVAIAPPQCPPPPPPVADELPLPPPPPTQPVSPVAVHRLDTALRRPQGPAFRLRPQVLALGGAVAMALLAVWSEGTVAAFTVAVLSLLWIESSVSRRRRATETEALLDSCGRRPASPIREAEEAPRRSSCSDSGRGNEPPSPRTAERRELVAANGDDEPTTPKQRSLRKLISKKLQKKREPKDSPGSLDCEAEQREADDPILKIVPLVTASSESSLEWSSSSSSSLSSDAEVALAVDGRAGPGSRSPLAAFIPVILAGLAAGKLPATALAVLCVVFSTAVQRL